MYYQLTYRYRWSTGFNYESVRQRFAVPVDASFRFIVFEVYEERTELVKYADQRLVKCKKV